MCRADARCASRVREFLFPSTSPQETHRLGAALGRLAEPGLVVALKGPLGAGKTTFTRGVAEGVGADARTVTSPTFVLIQEHFGRIPVYHFDAYRLASQHDFADLGADEYFHGDGLCLVEWADRVEPLLPSERIEVTFRLSGPQARHIEIRAIGEQTARLINRWNQSLQ